MGAQFRLAVAAVLEQEQDQAANRAKLDPADHAAAMPLDRDEACPYQDCQMGGEGVVRDIEPPGDLASRQAVWLLRYQQPDGLKPRGLGKGRKDINGKVLSHMSGRIDKICDSHLTAMAIWPELRTTAPCETERKRIRGGRIRRGGQRDGGGGRPVPERLSTWQWISNVYGGPALPGGRIRRGS